MGKVSRIGHVGWMNEGMVTTALSVAEMSMIDTGMDIEAGSGVAAAIRHFTKTSAQTGTKAAA